MKQSLLLGLAIKCLLLLNKLMKRGISTVKEPGWKEKVSFPFEEQRQKRNEKGLAFSHMTTVSKDLPSNQREFKFVISIVNKN